MTKKKEDESGTTRVGDLADALMDFPIDGIEIEQGDSDFSEEEIEQMAQGKTLAEIRGQQKAPEASAPVAQPAAKKQEASPPKAKEGKGEEKEAPKAAPAKEEEASAAQPKGKAVIRIPKKKPSGEAKPAAKAKPAEGEAGGEKALPYIRVTTDGKGRAQLGADASAPVATWRVEVIDPKTSEPLPFGDNGETFVDLEGHPLLNYMRLEHDLKPKIMAKFGEIQKEVKGVVDRTSEQEEKFESDEEKAATEFDDILGELKGTDAYRYLTQTRYAAEGEKGLIEVSVAPWQMVKMILQRVIGYTGGEGSNRDAADRALSKALGMSFEQADRLIDAAYKLTGILPETADKLARKRESSAYWNDQFEQGLNLGGNFQSLYNYMLMDSNDRNRPMMTAFRNGQRQDIIDWDKFYDTEGPVGKRVRVHPSLDLPFLYADSEEAKAMIDAARGEDGKIDFKKLEDALAEANAELFGKDRFLELTDSLGKRKTLVPDWGLIKKYGTLQRSLGENWARFIRGTGGFNFQGGINSGRLGPGSDLGDAQYNPVLRNLYARAVYEAPEIAKVLHDYYLNYGEEPFSPSGEQLLMFARQPELLAGNTLDWLYSDEGKGKLDNATGFSKNNLDAIANSLSRIIWLPVQRDYDVLNEAFPGVYTPTGDVDSRGNAKFDKSEELASRIKPIRDAWNAELRRQGRKKTTKQRGKAADGFASGSWHRSPEWQKLVLRAFFEEIMENPDLPRRLVDPSGFNKTYALGNVAQLEDRQEAAYFNLLNKIDNGEEFTVPEREAFKAYDIPIEEARALQYSMAKRMLDMLLNGTKNVRYVDGKGMVRNVSDRRVKRPARRGKKLGARLASLLANSFEGPQVSDKRAKEPSDWESWEARRKMLIGEDR